MTGLLSREQNILFLHYKRYYRFYSFKNIILYNFFGVVYAIDEWFVCTYSASYASDHISEFDIPRG